MPTIQEVLEKRIAASKNNLLKEQFKIDKAQYEKDWAKAVQCFQVRVNVDRKKQKQKPLGFMAIRSKLAAVKEIDDLRWFYGQCLKYSYKKGNTFSKCFWGALKIK